MVDQGLGNFFQPNALTIIEHTNNGGLGLKKQKPVISDHRLANY